MAWSWRARRQPATHKRLILLATITLIDAAIGRWPVAVLQAHPPLMGVVELGFVVLMMLFMRVPISQTKAWMVFAGMFAK